MDRHGHGPSVPGRPRAGYEGPWYDDPLYRGWWERADLRQARGRGEGRGEEVYPVEQHYPLRSWDYLIITRRHA